MKKLIIIFICYVQGVIAISQTTTSHIAIIPEPVTTVQNTGSFLLPESIAIEAPALTALQPSLQFLKERLSVPTGYNVSISAKASTANIRLTLNPTADQTIGNEGYKLSVTPAMISVSANAPAGLFYGIQTLLQLLPAPIESTVAAHADKWQVPCVEITDYPRFGWRGLMFDVSRHFFTKKEVMDFIDQMARYKFNVLHWHLTDDEGWRLEIKSLPNLTAKGAWRVGKTGYFGTFSDPTPGEPLSYGGFYTQEDIKEVIQYAKDRFVNILPEVDMPGHSMAALASYPELACDPLPSNFAVAAGQKTMEWPDSGAFYALVDHNLCPANEKTYSFIDKVFSEIATLFPFEYIHIGGDECAKNLWEKSEAVKGLMKKENLKTMSDVQSYFEKRVEKIITAKGKKVIGWDEILEGGLAGSAAVMSWRGEKGGIEAAKLKHEVVMSPSSSVYLDFMQGDEIIEPKVYATLRLNKIYEFEPVPPGTDAKYIKGGQGNIWTEQITNVRHLQYMTWPRAFAVAESVWSPKEKKNWTSFVQRVEEQFKRYDVREIKYSSSMYDPIFAAKDNNGKLQIELASEIAGLDIYYSFDNSFPDRYYPKYKEALTPPKDAVMLKVVTYKGDKPVGRTIDMPLDEMNKRAGLKK